MTLILRPQGRGNWKPLVIEVTESKHSPLPLEVYVGQPVVIGGHTYRISKVTP